MKRAASIVGSALILSGCTNACPNAPACEDDWPAAALAIHQWQDGNEISEVWDDASSLIMGEKEEGSDWRVASHNSNIWLGMPDINTVKQVELTDFVAEETGASWEAIEGRLGSQVEVVDLDDDGHVELLISAPEWSLQRGLVALFRSPLAQEGQTLADAALLITGGESGDHLGSRIAVCGDLSGDGTPDLAVHIPWRSDAPVTPAQAIEPLAGAVGLLRSELMLEANGTVPWHELGPTWWGSEEGDALGYALTCDSDINGDGQPDLIMGAPWAGDEDRGKVYGFLGGDLPDSGPIDSLRDLEIIGTGSESWAGMELTTLHLPEQAGASVIVGEPGYNQGRGRAVLYPPNLIIESPLSPKYLYILRGSEEPGGAMHFGRVLQTGDLDGDNLTDLLIGAPDFRYERRSDAGRAWIYLGLNNMDWDAEGAAEQIADGQIWGPQAFHRVSLSMRVRDLNADGRGDILLPTRAASP